MPILYLDVSLERRFDKLSRKKIPNLQDRWDQTKSKFDGDMSDPALRFKKYQGVKGAFEIRLLSLEGLDNSDWRILIYKDSEGDYTATKLITHDDMRKRK